MDIEKFLSPDETDDLTKLLRRLTYEDAYRCADAGDYAGTPEGEGYRKAMAYRFLAAVGKLEKCLAETGL